MAERYTVRVTKDYLVFCSGHFITYEGSQCERLHGHNYHVAASVEGPLDENHYLFDFVALKNIMRRLTDELDHFMMIATQSKLIIADITDERVKLNFKGKEWIFPRSDCVLLPIENTTAELLAKYLTGRLLEELRTHQHFVPEVARMEVEESVGQTATYEWRRG
ncbi:6-pyruvoyl trahydropterin synthase family protein [Zavarzinella formosa]|uniref:6-pyruvoyl trahydropterin synthase family protein n=1 Tax=Zavarzinella formosa TaxID=360055 RepID=UPI0002E0AE6E|nr:6-carboxytetrahydropterin synthase [Zavarzinella formosa]